MSSINPLQANCKLIDNSVGMSEIASFYILNLKIVVRSQKVNSGPVKSHVSGNPPSVPWLQIYSEHKLYEPWNTS